MSALRAAAGTARALFFALALVGCGGGTDPALLAGEDLLPRVAAASDARPDASDAALDLWLGGPARVALARVGPGKAAATLEQDEAPAVELAQVRGDGRAVLVDLPDGPRAVRLRLGGDAREWTLVRLVAGDAAPVAREPESLRGRSVLLLVCDSLAAAHVSCYGNPRPTTPHLDRLAQRGARFETAYSQSAWTLPSVASLFTSEEQERHGVVKTGLQLGLEPSTLAELFRAAGYRTLGLVQNGAVGPHSGLGRGFDAYEGVRYESAELLFKRCEEELAKEEPVFLYLHLLAPHMPYMPRLAYRGTFDPGYAGKIDGSVRACAEISTSGKPPDDPDVVHLAALYDEYLRTIDEDIGAFFARLEASGRDRELLIVFTADHGEAFQQHGVSGHGPKVHEEMVRVPLLMSAPGASWSRGITPAATASLLDVLPTLVELFGLPAPRQACRGRSLAPDLAGAVAATRPLFLSARYEADVPRQRGVRAGPYKWLEDPATGAAHVYDLERDPGELHDLSAERPILAAALAELQRRWSEEARSSVRAAASTVDVDAEVLDELEALGYAGSDE